MAAAASDAGSREAGRWRWLTLAPAACVYLAVAVLPIANLVAMSLHDIRWVDGIAQWTWSGVRHYAALGADPLVAASVRNTAVFAALAVAIEMLLGFLLAHWVSRAGRSRGWARRVRSPGRPRSCSGSAADATSRRSRDPRG